LTLVNAESTTTGELVQEQQLLTTPLVPIPAVLAIQTRLYGTINGKEFDLRGGGEGRPYDGIIKVEYVSQLGPVHFPMHLMDIPAIMGYPTFSRHQQGCFDLFKLSNGYEYERHIAYDGGGRSDSVHKVTYLGDKIVGDFKVDAEVDAPTLTDVEPLVETMVPAGPGKVASTFWAHWRTREGCLFRGAVESEYRLTHNATLPWAQFRQVIFDSNHTQEVFRQSEELNVFRSVPQYANAGR
jgi:hypothetical protein